ncbi:MAG TPA: aminotransferase class III-fold pyridoxal phosphate-dependent enzyme [Bacteroidia bacterium]|nr:aminotransferase class III-fold pyridoxal phosphate-dependent enzyme [Bacteroidia bacterium]
MYTRRQIFLQHVAQTSPTPPALDIARAKGVYLYDQDNKKYLDLISGISVSSLGHGHSEILEATKAQIDRHMHLMVYGEYIISPQIKLAQELSKQLPEQLSTVYFTNSGTEATEGAMKLTKRFTGRTNFVSFRNSYHGSTQGALSICGNEWLKNAYRPLLSGQTILDFNDESQFNLIDQHTAAVFVEPIQAEAGIILPENNFLEKLSAHCKKVGALLVFDEIQTGMGRTGRLFAFQHYNVVPDILLLGKALGGGMPLGAFISSSEIMKTLSHDPILGHLTTFGGHPVCCASASAALEIIVRDKLAEIVIEKEKLFRKLLVHENIRIIRGKGLLLCIEFESEKFNQDVIAKCYDKGLITDWFLFAANCLRIAPPLIISDLEIEDACRIILEAIDEVKKEF